MLLGAWLVLWCAVRPCRADGPGILLGEQFVLHAGFASELRYDSNIFLSNGSLGAGLPAQALTLRLLPSIDISTLSLRRGGLTPHNVELRFHAGLDYKEYLTPDSNISEHRSLGVEVGGLAMLFPRSALNVDLYDNFLRTNQPPYTYNPYNIDRNTNIFGIRVRYAPGGRRLQLSLIYELSFDGFDNIAGGPNLSELDLLTNSLVLRASWKFLPKTALFIELNQQFLSYLDNAADNQVLHSASYPFRATAGVMGLITQKISVDLQGGYGYSYYPDGISASTAVIVASIKYKPAFLSTVTLDYRHDFANSLIGSYFDLDTAGVSYSHLIYRVTVFGHFAYERMAFEGSPAQLIGAGICINGETMPCVPQLNRVDNYLTFDARVEVPVRDWLVPSVGYSLQSNISNGYTTVQSIITPVSYTKHEAWIRLTVRY